MQAKHGTKKVLEDILEMFKDCFGTSIILTFYTFFSMSLFTIIFHFAKNYKTDKQKKIIWYQSIRVFLDSSEEDNLSFEDNAKSDVKKFGRLFSLDCLGMHILWVW